MSGFQSALKAEFQKGKNSFALWLSLFGTVANVLMFSLYFLFRPESGSEGMERTPWEEFIVLFYDSVSFMMLPLYVIILCSLITFQEHRSGSWINLMSLPLTRWQLYWGKQVYILLHFMAAHLLFVFGMLLAGFLIGLLFPASGLLDLPPFRLIASLATYTILSILGLLAFHAWVSWRFSHFIIPLTIGIIGFVLAAILGPEWPGAVGFWYATPIVYMPDWRGVVAYGSWAGIGIHYWASLLWFGVFTLIGYLDIRGRDMV